MPYKKTNKPSGMQSFPDAKSKTDTTGYMSLERRIKSLQHAGQILHAARATQFDGDSENYTAPPHRGLQPDLADLSQLAMENAERTAAIKARFKEKFKKVQAANKATLEAQKAAKPQNATTVETTEQNSAENNPDEVTE